MTSPQPRPSIAQIPPYVAGKPPAPRADLTTYKLSSNENPYPPLPSVLATVREGAESFNRYPDMFATGEPPSEITRRKGIKQVDEAAIDEIVLGTITAHPDQVKQYLAGKMAVVGFLVGKAMKQSHGQADPVKVKLLLEQKLKELPKP